MNLHEGLGFKFLSYQEQEAYKVMLKFFSTMEATLDCSQMDRGIDLMKVMQTVLRDNPSIIYFKKTEIRIKESAMYKRIILKEVRLKSQLQKMNMALEATANAIIYKAISSVRSMPNDKLSLLIYIYNYLQKHVRYDKREYQVISKRGTGNSLEAHNAYGALIHRVAVCDGFSSAFALLAQKLGFDCMIVSGLGSSSSTEEPEPHAWNVVRVIDRFYHMDVTWDASAYKSRRKYSYDYFAISDEEISVDHDWDKATTPICLSNDFSCHMKNLLYAENDEQLNEIIKGHSQKGTKIFRLKLSNNVLLPNNAGEYLAQKILDEAVNAKENIKICYNWDDNTRYFFARTMN